MQFSLHDLRRGFSIAAHEAGVPLEIIGRLLNHAESSRIATFGYIHTSPETLRPWLNKIDAALRGEQPARLLRPMELQEPALPTNSPRQP